MSKPKSLAIVPPAGLVPDRVVNELDYSADAINDYEKALGGRKSLVATLSLDSTPEIQQLVQMLNDHQYDGRSFGWLARQVGIGLSDLLRSFRNGTLAKAQILAAQKIAVRLVDVVDDVMKRAAPYEETCEPCGGLGEIVPKPSRKQPNPEPVTCRVCSGKGKFIHQAELDRQRLALELAELIKVPRNHPSILQQFNMGSPSAARETGAGSLEQLQQAVTSMLYGNRTNIIDLIPEDESDGQ